MNVVIYTRNDINNQQLKRIEEKFDMEGVKSVQLIKDTGSGMTSLEGYEMLLKQIANKEVDIIYVESLQRISRSFDSLSNFLLALDKLDVKLVVSTGEMPDIELVKSIRNRRRHEEAIFKNKTSVLKRNVTDNDVVVIKSIRSLDKHHMRAFKIFKQILRENEKVVVNNICFDSRNTFHKALLPLIYECTNEKELHWVIKKTEEYFQKIKAKS